MKSLFFLLLLFFVLQLNSQNSFISINAGVQMPLAEYGTMEFSFMEDLMADLPINLSVDESLFATVKPGDFVQFEAGRDFEIGAGGIVNFSVIYGYSEMKFDEEAFESEITQLTWGLFELDARRNPFTLRNSGLKFGYSYKVTDKIQAGLSVTAGLLNMDVPEMTAIIPINTSEIPVDELLGGFGDLSGLMGGGSEEEAPSTETDPLIIDYPLSFENKKISTVYFEPALGLKLFMSENLFLALSVSFQQSLKFEEEIRMGSLLINSIDTYSGSISNMRYSAGIGFNL